MRMKVMKLTEVGENRARWEKMKDVAEGGVGGRSRRRRRRRRRKRSRRTEQKDEENCCMENRLSAGLSAVLFPVVSPSIPPAGNGHKPSFRHTHPPHIAQRPDYHIEAAAPTLGFA